MDTIPVVIALCGAGFMTFVGYFLAKVD